MQENEVSQANRLNIRYDISKRLEFTKGSPEETILILFLQQ